MKTIQQIATILVLTLFYSVAGAQIRFEKNSHNFGEIAEDGGSVSQNFTFRNISDEPVVVVWTYTSCGCTTAEFSKKPVLPGETSSIKVVFSPMNYPGSFARKVTVVTNKGAMKDVLLITGYVRPRVKSIEERFPLDMGNGVRAATNAHSFGYVEHGKLKQSSFEIFNGGQRGVALAIENPYKELEFYLPSTLAPGKEAAINFGCMLPDDSSVYGSLAYSVWLVIDGVKAPYPFIINGLAIDSRDENVNNSPQMIAMSENFIKFGAVKCGVVEVVRTIKVYNRGNKALTIRKVELDKDGFAANLVGSSIIEPGGSRTVKVAINPSLLPFGAVVEKMRIVSTDPQMPVLTVRVSAIVEE